MHREAAGHAEVHEQDIAPRQVRQQVLGPPLQPLDLPSAHARGKIRRQRKAQVLAVLVELGDALALEHGQKPAPHGLDFGQLGHA